MHEPEEVNPLRSLFVPFTSKKAIISLVVIGLILYAGSLFNSFVGDDNTQIVNNPAIRSLKNLPAFFFESRLDVGGTAKLGATYYKPFLDTSYLLLYQFFGPKPFWYHVVQLILYLSTVVLLFLFLRRNFSLILSFLLTLLFLVHPINSEVVLYAADLQDILFLFFGLLALLIIKKESKLKHFIGMSMLLLSSLFSKETGILFILLVPIYAFFFYKKYFTRTTITCIASVFLYMIFRLHAVGLPATPLVSAPIQKLDLIHRLIHIPAMLSFYLQTFLFPYNLSSSWQWVYPNIDLVHFVLPLLMVLIFVGLIFIFIKQLRTKKSKETTLFVFFTCWFFLGLFFHLQIFPLDQTVAERWFYFSFVGILGMVGTTLKVYKINFKNQWVLTIIIGIFCLLTIKTWLRTFDYRNDFTLASRDVQVTHDSYNLEYILSHQYYAAGMLKPALEHAERSVALFPYITNYTNLGAIKSQMGDYKGAKEAYQQALRYGEDQLPYENLSSVALVYGDPADNIRFIKQIALKKYPKNQKMLTNLALLTYMYGDKKEAKAYLMQAKKEGTSSYITYIQSLMDSGKPLRIRAKNGMVTFDTSPQAK